MEGGKKQGSLPMEKDHEPLLDKVIICPFDKFGITSSAVTTSSYSEIQPSAPDAEIISIGMPEKKIGAVVAVKSRSGRNSSSGGEQGELIAPCRCSGGQKWVNSSMMQIRRRSLRRVFTDIKEQIPFAFTRCPTCHFDYVTREITPQATQAQKMRYVFLVSRDIGAGLFATIAAMVLLGVLASACDPSPRRPLLHLVEHKPLHVPKLMFQNVYIYPFCLAVRFNVTSATGSIRPNEATSS
eukprot:jgi/Bigna1/136559/aug1.34_g11267